MNGIDYEVWGRDTFANEDYLVGVFSTRTEADKALRKSERSVLSQCEELRDTFWVEEMTPKRREERDERECKREECLRKRRDFDYTHLCEIVARLNANLLQTVDKDKRGLILETEVNLLEKNEKSDDCYSYLSFQYVRKVKDGKMCLVLIEVGMKEEGKVSMNCFMGTPDQIRRQFSFKKGETFVREIVYKMIMEFFR